MRRASAGASPTTAAPSRFSTSSCGRASRRCSAGWPVTLTSGWHTAPTRCGAATSSFQRSGLLLRASRRAAGGRPGRHAATRPGERCASVPRRLRRRASARPLHVGALSRSQRGRPPLRARDRGSRHVARVAPHERRVARRGSRSPAPPQVSRCQTRAGSCVETVAPSAARRLAPNAHGRVKSRRSHRNPA